jgi:anti-sigma B factor antagonist
MIKPFETQIRLVPGAAMIDLHGEINSAAENALNKAYAEAKSSNPQMIILNFSSVDYINSSGIALIVGLLADSRKSHFRLVVYGLMEHYQEIFHITRLSDFIQIYLDEESALKDLTVYQ